MKPNPTLSWIFRIVSAVILIQTLYFKFTGHPDSMYIFTTLGMEPYGRIGTGIIELLVSIGLFIPRFIGISAAVGMGTLAGAIFLHLTVLGIVVQNDGGSLFALAVLNLFTCAVVLWLYRKETPVLKQLFK